MCLFVCLSLSLSLHIHIYTNRALTDYVRVPLSALFLTCRATKICTDSDRLHRGNEHYFALSQSIRIPKVDTFVCKLYIIT